MNRPLPRDERSEAAAALQRRSDRVAIEVPIEVVGSDFLDQTRTVLVSRHGGKIVLNRILSPDEELTVLCKSTGKEAAVRVVGHLGEGPEGHYYGIAFLEPDVNLWDIEFPELSEIEKAAARVLLECAVCHARKVVYLDGAEAEVLEANHRLSIFCKHCSNSTFWLPVPASAASHDSSEQQAPGMADPLPVPLQPAWATERRKDGRLHLRVLVCIRDEELREEIAQTEDLSRGGFRFQSRRRYRAGSELQAALPYAPNQANIFIPCRVAHAEELAEGVFSYGISYHAASQGRPAS